ncbi:MAG TPA: ABC transporter permease [Candidatus Onthousia faecipullorum]|uniref:ABC transporter permease n=1 Tax=Candidatus Onthousia faecipullorum TaxID=2840887 RepID=A0A9D1KAZ7_9FIRM|nr:ABC transporter permease [Candidatus Onthousia faecipullorum]
MSRKFLYLTKVSLRKKFKTKWFVITNIILAVVLILLLNINSIVSFFGGDFDSKTNIIVIDNADSYDLFKQNIDSYASSLNEDEENLKLTIEKSNKSIEELEEALEDDEILIELNSDNMEYLTAKITSNKKIDTLTYQVISQSLNSTKTTIGMAINNIDATTLNNISSPITINRVVLNEDNNVDENMGLIMSSVFPTIILPFFMLTMILIQMVGGEICEEKTTRSMEIIISNVSPKQHLMSKILASNIFVIVQGLLLVVYAVIGLLISTNMLSSGMSLPSEVTSIFDSLVSSGFMEKLIYVIPLTLILIVLSFLAYSIVAGILASMTVNMEDFSQLQTPLVFLSLGGYYLAMMAGMFNGSILIRILSYVPFLSSFVSPSLYMMGEIGLIDIVISIIVLIAFIYLILHFGIRVYKVGILNYSNEKVWSKLFKAFKSKDV